MIFKWFVRKIFEAGFNAGQKYMDGMDDSQISPILEMEFEKFFQEVSK